MALKWELSIWVRVDLGVMAIKQYSTFSKVPALLSDTVYCRTQKTHWGSLTLLHWWRQHILQPQRTGQINIWVYIDIYKSEVYIYILFIKIFIREIFPRREFKDTVYLYIAFLYIYLLQPDELPMHFEEICQAKIWSVLLCTWTDLYLSIHFFFWNFSVQVNISFFMLIKSLRDQSIGHNDIQSRLNQREKTYQSSSSNLSTETISWILLWI